eukprot:scpid77507/ scgid26725/ 
MTSAYSLNPSEQQGPILCIRFQSTPPVTKRNGEVIMASAVYFPDLVDIVTHYLDMFEEHDQLTWHAGIIPADKIWLKLGGDHGGGSFKFVMQVANRHKPNSPDNTIPICTFSCHDTFAYLDTMLKMYSACWKSTLFPPSSSSVSASNISAAPCKHIIPEHDACKPVKSKWPKQ